MRLEVFGVVGGDRYGVNDGIVSVHLLAFVPEIDLDPGFREPFGQGRRGSVRAADVEAVSFGDLRERGHIYPADAYKIYIFSF